MNSKAVALICTYEVQLLPELIPHKAEPVSQGNPDVRECAK
ncbi:hypothetical protein PEL8287_00022 [Roseovarius litorisediminis]|uniref:Uncharacterized protein n=1 Tax=Roseovarius litorisediminis TaxID=1312363 RepID=A0A1Y5R5M0_9RHOB|nr:hypothetical protein PEL8287_00022 [Roseovarius litorisediminis]